jgi:hypothetical protein
MRVFVLGAVLSFLSALAFGQAVVNENRETAFIYVDGAKGSDSNPGTKQSPLKTIGAAATIAIANNKASIGTRVTINSGTYRESVTLQGGKTDLPITLEAETNGTVTVDGAISYKSWNVYNGNRSIYTSPWPNRWGLCTADGDGAPLEQPIVLRREMVVVNGAPMTEVLDLASMVYPGTFYVDESSGLLYVWPPADTDMSTAEVEVASAPTVLTIGNMNGVVVRGINFTHASSCHGESSVLVNSSSNVLFDTAGFLWNGGQGVAVSHPSSDITFLNSTANHNGSAGFQMWQVLNVLWQNDTASYNNWRGAQGAYYVWNAGGAHVFSDHNETYKNFTAEYNQSFSIHWDTDNVDISVNKMLASQNFLGAFDEKNQGPITISDSTFCNGMMGFEIRNSTNLSLTDNVFYNNSDSQVYITGVPGGQRITDWATGDSYNLITSHLTMTGNTIDSANANQQVFEDSFLGGSDWTQFVNTLTSNDNGWWNPASSTPFSVPAPSLGTELSFAGWKAATGQDGGSTFSAPEVNPSAACTVSADAPDWWLTLNRLVGTPLAAAGTFPTDPSGSVVIPISNEALGGWKGTVTFAVSGLSSIPGGSVSFSPTTISANGTTNLTLKTPASTPPGDYTLVVLANSGNVTRTVTLTVTVPVTSVHLSTTSVAFGDEPIGFSTTPRVVTLTNTGKSAITISSMVPKYGFSETNTCGKSVAAGAQCSISISFSPTHVETYTGNLTITDSDGTSPQIITLTGTGTGSPKVEMSVHSISFGGVVYETPSSDHTVTFTNTGSAPLTISTVKFTGSNASDFTSSNCSKPIPVNGTCTLKVVLTPTIVGAATAALDLEDNASDSPQTLNLNGNGLTAIKVSPNSMNFGTVSVGDTGSTKTVTIANLSTASLRVSKLELAGANPSDFALSQNTCGTSLQGSKSCSISITFAPKATGSLAAKLTIDDGDPTSPQNVTLIGTGR